jgi:hypothetical protein
MLIPPFLPEARRVIENPASQFIRHDCANRFRLATDFWLIVVKLARYAFYKVFDRQ